MSDYLTADSSDMVFCHSPAQDGQHIVFACSRDALDDLMDEARARNLELLGIWPDYMTVGKPSDGIAVLEDGNDILRGAQTVAVFVCRNICRQPAQR